MISATQAIAAAKRKAAEYFDSPTDLALEEVDENSTSWFITVGFRVQRALTMQEEILGAIGSRKYDRVYKMFEVDKDSGEVKRMKIREP